MVSKTNNLLCVFFQKYMEGLITLFSPQRMNACMAFDELRGRGICRPNPEWGTGGAQDVLSWPLLFHMLRV
jgi:hypothetical protein